MRSSTDFPLPFRWDITQPSQLGTLTDGEESEVYTGLYAELLPCAVKILAFARDSDLVFLGRSPDSLNDLLMGLLHETSWKDRLLRLPFGIGRRNAGTLAPQTVAAFRLYLDCLGLSPVKLTVRERPIALVDLVASGNTLRQFIYLLHQWAVEEKVDWPAIRRKIRIISIIRKKVPRPRSYSWRNDCEGWLRTILLSRAVKEVTIEEELWRYLVDDQEKTATSYRPEYWGKLEMAYPNRTECHLRALRSAWHLFQAGRSPENREQFAVSLTTQQIAMRQRWFRALVHEVRNCVGNRSGKTKLWSSKR